MSVSARPQANFLGLGVHVGVRTVVFVGDGIVLGIRPPIVRQGVAGFPARCLFLPSFPLINLLTLKGGKRRKSIRVFRWNSTGLSTGIPCLGLALAVISASFFRCRVHRNSTGLSAIGGEFSSPHGKHDDVHRHAFGRHLLDHVGDRGHCSFRASSANSGNFSKAVATPDISRATSISSSENLHRHLKITSRLRHINCSATIGERLNHSP